MTFCIKRIIKKRIKNTPLYVFYKKTKIKMNKFRNLFRTDIENPVNESRCKRESVSASLISCKGSLTIEAALVLPLFLFAMIALIYMTEVVRFSSNLDSAMSETAREASVYCYPYMELSGKTDIGGPAGSKILGLAGAKAVVLSRLGKDYISESPVRKDSGGISFIHSNVLKDEMIDLVAVWKTDIPFIPDELRAVKVIDRARVRAFTGYDNTHRSSEKTDEDETIVFVTDYGRVYHRDRNCSHLKLNIESVNRSDLKARRNDYGGKYYECEYCGRKCGEKCFITTDGDRYHSSLTCPGLKRGIHEVFLSDTELPPCSSCGS